MTGAGGNDTSLNDSTVHRDRLFRIKQQYIKLQKRRKDDVVDTVEFIDRGFGFSNLNDFGENTNDD
jgi:hypothetical protein